MTIASEITRLQNAKEAIRQAIIAKGVNVAQDTLLDYYPDYIDQLSSGDVVNGIIEQYKAESGTIDANTFVEFVSHGTSGFGTTVEVVSDGGGGSCSAVQLDDARVLLVYIDSSRYLYGVVLTISDTTITVGTAVQFARGDSSSDNWLCVTKVSTDKAVVTYRATNLNGVVLTISDTTITVGTAVQFSNNPQGSAERKAVALVTLEDDKALAVFTITSSKYLAAQVLTISDTTITLGTLVNSGGTAYPDISAVALTPTTVVTAFAGSSGASSSHLYASVLAISNTTVTFGASTLIDSRNYTGQVSSITKINDTMAFVAYSYGNTTSLYYAILNVLNGSVSGNIGTQIDSLSIAAVSTIYRGFGVVTCVLMGTSNNSGVYLRDYDMTTNTTSERIQLSDELSSHSHGSSSLAVCANSVGKTTIVYTADNPTGSGDKLAARVSGAAPITATPATSKIDGLTKTACTTSTAGDVWILNTNA